MSSRIPKIPEHYFKQYYELLEEVNGLQEIEVVIKNTDDKERITLMGVVDLLNDYVEIVTEMGTEIDSLEVEVKRLKEELRLALN